MEVVLTNPAWKSIACIAAYIENIFGKVTSSVAVHGIFSYVMALDKHPRIGRVVEKWSKYGEIRCAVYKQNLIYYMVTDDQVIVIVVWDCRQDIKRLDNIIEEFTKNYI